MIYLFNKTITYVIPYLPKFLIRFFSNRYIAGVTNSSSLITIKKINANNLSATIDILGEHTKTETEATNITNQYIELYKKIDEQNLDCNISIKPSHIGADISKELFLNNLRKIHSHAIKFENFLRLDMEDSTFTDLTISSFKEMYSNNTNIGIVIQAYLKRSEHDINNLTNGVNIRLCKGIYNENEVIAFKEPEKINENYINLFKKAVSKEIYVGIATHDLELIKKIIKIIEENNINKNNFEFQVLYGVPMGNAIKKLTDKGHKVRVYTPFGANWYDYSIRRLKENPNIAGYIIKNIFKKNFYK